MAGNTLCNDIPIGAILPGTQLQHTSTARGRTRISVCRMSHAASRGCQALKYALEYIATSTQRDSFAAPTFTTPINLTSTPLLQRQSGRNWHQAFSAQLSCSACALPMKSSPYWVLSSPWVIEDGAPRSPTRGETDTAPRTSRCRGKGSSFSSISVSTSWAFRQEQRGQSLLRAGAARLESWVSNSTPLHDVLSGAPVHLQYPNRQFPGLLASTQLTKVN